MTSQQNKTVISSVLLTSLLICLKNLRNTSPAVLQHASWTGESGRGGGQWDGCIYMYSGGEERHT